MNEVIVFPDAAALTIDYLMAQLAARSIDATVGSRIPSPINDTFVRVFRTGGLANEATAFLTEQVQLTFEIYSLKAETAHDVAMLCRGLVHAMQGTVQDTVTVYGVDEFSGPQEFPDPLTEKPRWVFTLQVSVRGAAS